MMLLLLPGFLRLYSQWNPSASILLQSDNQNCFYRMFVTVPDAANLFKHVCIPALFIDGTFSKIHEYDGCLVPVVAPNGNGGNMHLACGWVPNESIDSFVFIIRSLHSSGIDVEGVPIFTDRGHLLGAVRVLLTSFGIHISVKYCLEHIWRNVCHKFLFNPDAKEIQALRNVIADMQRARNVGAFIEACRDVTALMRERGAEIVQYLMEGIHPRHWTVFGNLMSYEDTEWEPEYYTYFGTVMNKPDLPWTEIRRLHLKDNVPFGRKFPLFGFCRTNRVESANSWLSHNKIRSSPPAVAVGCYLVAARKAHEFFLKQVQHAMDSPLLSVGSRLFQDGKQQSVQCETTQDYTEEGVHMIGVYSHKDLKEYVVKASTVNGQAMIKCKCFMGDMYNVVCGHIHRVLQTTDLLKGMYPHPEEAQRSTIAASPAWAVTQSVRSYFNTYRIFRVPGWGNINTIDKGDLLDPAPVYKAGRQNTKRLRSNGELKPVGAPKGKKRKTTYMARGITSSSEVTSHVKFSQEDLNVIRSAKHSGYYSFFQEFDPDMDGKLEKAFHRVCPRSHVKTYNCSCCFDVGHNIRNCSVYLKAGRRHRPPPEVKLGRVIVTHFPHQMKNPEMPQNLGVRSSEPYLSIPSSDPNFSTQQGSYEAISRDDDDYTKQVTQLIDTFVKSPLDTPPVDLELPIEDDWIVAEEKGHYVIMALRQVQSQCSREHHHPEIENNLIAEITERAEENSCSDIVVVGVLPESGCQSKIPENANSTADAIELIDHSPQQNGQLSNGESSVCSQGGSNENSGSETFLAEASDVLYVGEPGRIANEPKAGFPAASSIEGSDGCRSKERTDAAGTLDVPPEVYVEADREALDSLAGDFVEENPANEPPLEQYHDQSSTSSTSSVMPREMKAETECSDSSDMYDVLSSNDDTDSSVIEGTAVVSMPIGVRFYGSIKGTAVVRSDDAASNFYMRHENRFSSENDIAILLRDHEFFVSDAFKSTNKSVGNNSRPVYDLMDDGSTENTNEGALNKPVPNDDDKIISKRMSEELDHLRDVMTEKLQNPRIEKKTFNKLGGSNCFYHQSECALDVLTRLMKTYNSLKKKKGKDYPLLSIPIYKDVLEIGTNHFQRFHASRGRAAWFTDRMVNGFIQIWGKQMCCDMQVHAHSSDILGILDGKRDSKGRLDLHLVVRAEKVMSAVTHRGVHLFPRCHSGHWWLMIVDHEKQTVYSIDSLDEEGNDHYTDARTLVSLMKIRLMRTKKHMLRRVTGRNQIRPDVPDMSGWVYSKLPVPKGKKQGDDWNCGAFVCLYSMLILTHGRSVLKNGTWLLNSIGGGNELRLFVFDVIFRYGEAVKL